MSIMPRRGDSPSNGYRNLTPLRRYRLFEILAYLFLLLAAVLGLIVFFQTRHVHAQEIAQNQARVEAEARISTRACNDVHRVAVVLEQYIEKSAEAPAFALPDLTPDQVKALEALQSAEAQSDAQLVKNLEAADCSHPQKGG